MNWILLILTLPTENATARMRAWRTLKNSGAAVLRDGVYLMPEGDGGKVLLADIAEDIEKSGGTTYLLSTHADRDVFAGMFDRSAEFAELADAISQARAGLTDDTAADTLKQSRKLRKSFEQLCTIDFFADEAQRQTSAALLELENAVIRTLSPDEPHAISGDIAKLLVKDYQKRVWATRARPWMDRLASAWLIRRYIDPKAKILWLQSPSDCPPDALGFDFDGATFSHVGAKVTFETLLTSFGLESPTLNRLGSIVHFIDAGGIQPPEAAGIERVLVGIRATVHDDDQLLMIASGIFDALVTTFEQEISG
ncbi:chromate resistance protein ChrB domain-containing protein [Oxalicibacterium solurbis]|uniref:Chromate resistance protein n=1 Tax=Oxalicibacterium solurbis TaxID=69280 RepID=A0A8J3AU35_9BURK|nr:chromate resistance protein ChrB domain-containing protein [Oxalicibacterium solurbis]GGI53225.1 chromate resistance protein [Oxalicibacterium solurbis]